MLFSSFEFLFIFLPICTLALVLARPLGRRTSLAGIVAASLYFYGWFYPPFYEVPVVNPGASLGAVSENLNHLSVLSTLLSTGEVPL
jgi:hypothetical protein